MRKLLLPALAGLVLVLVALAAVQAQEGKSEPGTAAPTLSGDTAQTNRPKDGSDRKDYGQANATLLNLDKNGAGNAQSPAAPVGSSGTQSGRATTSR